MLMGEIEVEWSYRKQGGDATIEGSTTEPVQEDFFQHIYNVHWVGGAIFLTKGYDSTLFLGDVQNIDQQKWSKIGKPFNANWFAFAGWGGSSYAMVGEQPVFLVLTTWVTDTDDGSMILASRDGIEWTNVFIRAESRPIGPYWFFEPNGIVWDPDDPKDETGKSSGTFYASFFRANFQVTDGVG